MSRSTRKRTAAFEWHSNDYSEEGPPPTVRLRHTDISINAAGPSTMQSSYITAPASPSKAVLTNRVYAEDYLLHQMGLLAEVDDGMGGGLGERLDDAEYAEEGELAIDPKYLLQRDEQGGTKQKRTQVCDEYHSH